MPEGVVKAFGILKGAAATVNMKFGLGTRSFTSVMLNKNFLTISACSRPQDW